MKSNTIIIVLLLLVSGSVFAQGQYRVEKDLLGEKQIPADAYYGVQTLRALENFQISGTPISHYPGFVEAWAIVKLAAARANNDVGALSKEKLDAIEKACDAVMKGKYHDQFKVDFYQGGAGTSTNMNANEVLANVGLELTGHKKGDYHTVEPHDDLNMSQSTNDSYPTALKVAFLLRNDKLVAELENLAASFRVKGDAFLRIVKMGRTELQDAVPMTVGQEFHAFAASLESEIALLKDSEKYLYEVNMGATAIGTGLNVPKGYPEKCAAHLAELTKKPIVPAKDMIAATWDQQGFVVYSAALRSVAIKLSKIAGDLILLGSGPRAGLFEVKLPAMQPGSSIMPGKVNPVIPELVNLVAFRVMGNDFTVTLAAHSGQLQLNAYEPIEALAIMESQHLLFTTSQTFRKLCIDGITVNEDVLQEYMEKTVGIVTALNPVIGYEKATELAKEAYDTKKGILQIIREKKILTEDQIRDLLDPVKLTGLNPEQYKKEVVGGNMKAVKVLSVIFIVLLIASTMYAQGGKKPKVVIVATGGMIAGSAESATAAGYQSGAVGVDILIAAVPDLKKIADVSGEQVASIGSQDMNDEVWIKLANSVNEILARPDVSGVAITHGTDTLEETSYFLNLVVKSDKPVVMTGSMRPSTAMSADGPLNIYNAVGIAADPSSRGRGVLVVIDDDIHSAHDVIKTHTTDVATFTSGEAGLVGAVLFGKPDVWYRTPTQVNTSKSDLAIVPGKGLPRVDIIYAHANMSPDIIDSAVEKGAKGLVIAGVGDGNMTAPALDAVKRAIAKGVVVVRSSRTNGGVIRRNIEVNDDQVGTVASMELNPAKSRPLLQLALLKTSDPKKIQDYFDRY